MENQLEMPKVTKKEKQSLGRRQIVIACAMLLIAAALVLNFTLFGSKSDTVDPSTPSEDSGGSADAGSEVDGYFSATQVSRQRARDEALLVLQGVVDNENADEATKTNALLEISQLAKEMEAEANIEAMVLAKGFEQCVAIVNDGSCSVVVKSDGLVAGQISQINEIVYEQAGILPSSVRIITK